MCIALCTIVTHSIAQNRPDSFPPYPPDNHHCSDDDGRGDGPIASHVAWEVQIPHGKGQFWWIGAPIVKYRHFLLSCAKTAEPIHLPFRLWTRVAEGCTCSIIFARWRQYALVEGHVAVTCRITLNRPCTAAMRIMAYYFDHLLSLDITTYTVTQIATHFEPSTVLWTFHTIQPSSLTVEILLSFYSFSFYCIISCLFNLHHSL